MMNRRKHSDYTFANPSLCGVWRWLAVSFILFMAVPVYSHQAFNVSRGLAALERGDLETAETELQKARFANPDAAEIHYNLGIINYRKRDYSLAASYFAAAAALHKDSEGQSASLYNLGNAGFKAGDYAAAISAYENSLAIKKDERAQFNLEVAREKLRKQMEKQQQQEQQNQEGKGDENKSDSQKKDRQRDSQGDKQSENGQKDHSQQNGQKSDQEQPKSEKSDDGSEDGQSSSGQNKDETGQSGSENQGTEEGQKEGDPSENLNQSAANGENASQTQELNPEEDAAANQAGDDAESREQEPAAAEKDKNVPEASQRARAMKNSRVNPYMVEKILKDMERYEREAQLRYRNEGAGADEMDPFEMDAQQLREWFENRRRPSRQAPGNEPDW